MAIDCGSSKLLENYVFKGHKTDFAIFTVLPFVTSWAMCFTDKYLWKTSPNKLRGKSTTLAISKQEFFVTLVTTVNYCHKEIYYKCCRGPTYASETSYYKKFYKEQLWDKESNKNLVKQFFRRPIARGAIFLGG